MIKNNLNDFISLIEKLMCFEELKPNKKLNEILSTFVSITNNPVNNRDDLYSQLKKYFESTQKICMEAELALEHFWAEEIINSNNPIIKMNEFPYLKNYSMLCKEEIEIIKNYNNDAKNILFIGSGPLPLTAILLSEEYKVTVVDRDKKALECSKVLFETLRINNVNFINSDVSSVQNLEEYDVVILAASVGTNEGKLSITTNLYSKMKSNSIFLIRTVSGIKELLYPAILLNDLSKAVSKIEFFELNVEVINSVIAVTKYTDKENKANILETAFSKF